MRGRLAVHLVGFAGAGITAVLLYGITHDLMGVPRSDIVIDSIAGAGLIGLGCVAGTVLNRKR